MRAPRRSPARPRGARSRRAAAPERRPGLASFKLTVRKGAKVDRTDFETLDAALAELEARVREVRDEGPLDEVKAFRTYEPAERVAARIEISHGNLLRSRDAGVDVMGDGSLIPYRGSAFKRRLAPARDESPFDAVREALR